MMGGNFIIENEHIAKDYRNIAMHLSLHFYFPYYVKMI